MLGFIYFEPYGLFTGNGKYSHMKKNKVSGNLWQIRYTMLIEVKKAFEVFLNYKFRI